jgi:hypothetical protein
VYFSRELRTTNPRDYIYGLLGLIECGIVPDYKKDLGSVYGDAVAAWVRATHSLDCLALASSGMFGASELGTFPSWVPNFAQNFGG